MDVAANCSLRVKRPLLDPRFEGYKLSLEPLPCYQLELDAGIHINSTNRCGHLWRVKLCIWDVRMKMWSLISLWQK
uniref:NudC domain containing 1 n=1 Tax=Equus asinus TaxID=9793 RepID=A0A9L0JFU8_EQUAS